MNTIDDFFPSGKTMEDLNSLILEDIRLLNLIRERFREKNEPKVVKYADQMEQTLLNLFASVTAVVQDRIDSISAIQKQDLALLESIEKQEQSIPEGLSDRMKIPLKKANLAHAMLIHREIDLHKPLADFQRFEMKTSYIMLFSMNLKLNDILSKMTTNKQEYQNLRKELLGDIAGTIPLLGQAILIVKWLKTAEDLLQTEIRSFDDLDVLDAFEKEAHQWLGYTIDLIDFFQGLLEAPKDA